MILTIAGYRSVVITSREGGTIDVTPVNRHRGLRKLVRVLLLCNLQPPVGPILRPLGWLRSHMLCDKRYTVLILSNVPAGVQSGID